MSQEVHRERLDDGDLEIMAVPGSHAMFARHFEDSDDPQLFSLYPEEMEWAAEQLQELAEGSPE